MVMPMLLLLLVLMMLCLVATVLMLIELLVLIATAFMRIVLLLLVLNLLQMMRIVRQALDFDSITNQIVDVQPSQEEVCNVHHCCLLALSMPCSVPQLKFHVKLAR